MSNSSWKRANCPHGEGVCSKGKGKGKGNASVADAGDSFECNF